MTDKEDKALDALLDMIESALGARRRRSQRGIAWGANPAQTGVNVLRGVRRLDGADEAMS